MNKVTGSLTTARLAGLKERIDNREARIGIVGMGYVGLPLALLFSGERFRVTGFDISPDKVATLNAGGSYIVRILPAAIQQARQAGFRATADYAEIAQMDAIIVCVPTPLDEHHEPDLSYVVGTVESIAPHLHEGQLVVLESTTYPGTTEEVVVPLLEAGNPLGLKVARALDEPGIHVVFSPEREDPGNDTVARPDIPKVVGGCGPAAVELASALYGAIFRRIVPVSSPAAAEMTKLLENIYRCVNIALVNELKQLCMRMGIDIHEVIDAAKTKPFGFQAFYPGPGLGGHCIPIDPFYLSWKGQVVRAHRIGAVAGDDFADQDGVHHRPRQQKAAEFLERQHGIFHAQPGAAEWLRHQQGLQAEAAQALPQFRIVPRARRPQFRHAPVVGQETAHAVAQPILVLGEIEIHRNCLLTRETETPCGDDVALDLGRSGVDRHRPRLQELERKRRRPVHPDRPASERPPRQRLRWRFRC